MSGWINVYDELPKDDEYVFISFFDNSCNSSERHYGVGRYNLKNQLCDEGWEFPYPMNETTCVEESKVTHWMKIPKVPGWD